MSDPLGQTFWEAKLTQIRPYYCEIAPTIGVHVGLNIALVGLATRSKNLVPLTSRLVLEWFKIGVRSLQFGPG